MAKRGNHVPNGSWRPSACFNNLLCLLPAFAVVLIVSATLMNVDQLQTAVLSDVGDVNLGRSSDVVATDPNISQAKVTPAAITESSGEQPTRFPVFVLSGEHPKPPSDITRKDGGVAPSHQSAVENSGEQMKHSSGILPAGDQAKQPSDITTKDGGITPRHQPAVESSAEQIKHSPGILTAGDHAKQPSNITTKDGSIAPSHQSDVESSGEQPKDSSGILTASDKAKQPSNITTKEGGGIAPSPPAAESSGEQTKHSSGILTAGNHAKQPSNITTKEDGSIAPSPSAVEALSGDRAESQTAANIPEYPSTIVGVNGISEKNLSSIVAMNSDHEKKNPTNGSLENVQQEEEETCNLFEGKWVYDESARPLYSGHGCSYITEEVACDRYGRKDTGYQHWRWQPKGCNLARFNATKLLKRLEGKRMVFVGDSVNRNHWMSMVCLLESSIPVDRKDLEHHGSLLSFKAKDYNASIDFYWAPLLVESSGDDPIHHGGSDRIIRPESIEKHARHWEDADILVFYSYLWWKQPTIMFNLTGSSDDQNATIKEVDTLQAYERALKTWSDWLQFHMDAAKKQIYFVSLAPLHSWGNGLRSGYCYNETEPIYNDVWRITETDIAIMRKAEAAIKTLRDRGVYVQLLNITDLTGYRKDGHSSIYRKFWVYLTEEKIAHPRSYSDCIHWCLPGVPDVWNELLYAHIFPQEQRYSI